MDTNDVTAPKTVTEINLDFMKESSGEILDLQKKVRREDLGFGIYKMKVSSLSEFITSEQESMLKIDIDTGFTTKDGGVRVFSVLFWYNGFYADGNSRADRMIQFYKRVSGKDEMKRVSDIKNLVGLPFACATRKNEKGYFEFWYADNIKNIDRMQLTYKPKDLYKPLPSNTVTPGTDHNQYKSEVNNDDDLPF